MFEQLRKQAKENLSHWLGTAKYGNREVVHYSDHYECVESDSHFEFETLYVNEALDFLFPE